MDAPTSLPAEVALVRTTRVFDPDTVPDGLLSAHRIAEGVWGRLVVLEGSLEFTFEEPVASTRSVGAGESVVIPPEVAHHVTLDGPVRFHVEFHR